MPNAERTIRYNDGSDIPATLRGEVVVDGQWVAVHHKHPHSTKTVITEIPVHNIYEIRSYI